VPCARRCRAVPRGRGAGGLLQQVFCLTEFGPVRRAFAELLIEESLLHVAVFKESLRPNRDEMKERTADSSPPFAEGATGFGMTGHDEPAGLGEGERKRDSEAAIMKVDSE
jgi:hypothetical protein